MVEAVFRMADVESNLETLAALGLFDDKKWYADAVEAGYETNLLGFIFETGIKYESIAGLINTPYLTTSEGDHVLTLKLSEEESALIPLVTSPEFLCDWRSDEREIVTIDGEEVEQRLPWPVYNVDSVDVDNNPIVRQQGAGRIF